MDIWWSLLVAYLVGGIPTGALIAALNKKDIYMVGSHSGGATNLSRVGMGKKWYYIDLLLDMSKGFIVTWVASWVFHGVLILVAVHALAAVVGNCFSIWVYLWKAVIKTGKGVATAGGVFFCLKWPLAAAALVIWFVVGKVLKRRTTEYTAIASVTIAVLLLVAVWQVPDFSFMVRIPLTTILLLILLRHMPNLENLFNVTDKTEQVGFLFHPTSTTDAETFETLVGQFPPLKFFSKEWAVNTFLPRIPVRFLAKKPVLLRLKDGRTVRFCCWATPHTAKFIEKNAGPAFAAFVEAARLLVSTKGVKRIGLGAFSSIVHTEDAGGSGIQLAQTLHELGYEGDVATGNSLTCMTAIKSDLELIKRLNLNAQEEKIAIIGPGNIGKMVAKFLAGHFGTVVLVGRPATSLRPATDYSNLISEIKAENPEVECYQSTLEEALPRCRFVATISSAMSGLEFDENLLHRNAVIMDVSRPRNISKRIKRSDTLVIESGLFHTPNGETIPFDIGFGKHQPFLYPCMVDTISKSSQTGDEIGPLTVEMMEASWKRAEEAGFTLAGYRSPWGVISDKEIEMMKTAIQKENVAYVS